MVRSAAALAILLAIGSAGGAEESATLFIAGAVSAPGHLTLTDLTKAGFSAGRMGKDVPVLEKRSGWKKAVLASAVDGFTRLEVVDLGAR